MAVKVGSGGGDGPTTTQMTRSSASARYVCGGAVLLYVFCYLYFDLLIAVMQMEMVFRV